MQRLSAHKDPLHTAVLSALYSPHLRYTAWPWSCLGFCPVQPVGHNHTVNCLLKDVLGDLKAKQAATAAATASPAMLPAVNGKKIAAELP
jgi:hypothetical protein